LPVRQSWMVVMVTYQSAQSVRRILEGALFQFYQWAGP